MELQGTIKQIGETKEVGTKGFKVREFVITTDEKYPQHIPLQVTKDNCDELNQFSVGEKVIANINVRGREYKTKTGETKYFLSLEAWKVASTNARDMIDRNIDVNPGDLPF